MGFKCGQDRKFVNGVQEAVEQTRRQVPNSRTSKPLDEWCYGSDGSAFGSFRPHLHARRGESMSDGDFDRIAARIYARSKARHHATVQNYRGVWETV